MISKNFRQVTRFVVILALTLQSASAQKEDKENKENKDNKNDDVSSAPSMSGMPSLPPAPSFRPSPIPSSAPSMESQAPSIAASESPTESPSTSPTETASSTPTSKTPIPTMTPSADASAAPTTTTRPTSVASMPPTTAPSISSPPSDAPSLVPTNGFDAGTVSPGLECIDDPAFTNLTQDAFGNTTNCAWFEYYIFNSCRDFGDWNDNNGLTPNASCCVCGGGLYVDPNATPSPSSADPLRCGCRSCTDEIWNKRTGTSSFTCGDRISFLMSPNGGAMSEEDACYQIGHDEYPEDCKFCAPDYCVLDDPADHFHCGCPSCTDEAWNTDAEGETCGDRIMFLQNELDMERRKACEQVGFLEFPNICGACDPNTCSATRSSGGVRLQGANIMWKTMLALPMLGYVLFSLV